MKREGDRLIGLGTARGVPLSQVMERPPFSAVKPVTETLHGVSITDPYRWLEDQNSPDTRVDQAANSVCPAVS